jgi:predicted dehydrogenase
MKKIIESDITRRQFINFLGAAVGSAAMPFAGRANTALASERITLGFIGVGKQGAGLLRGFLNTPGTQVLAVCDVDMLKKENAQKMVNDHYTQESGHRYHSCDAYDDFRYILERPDIDAVVIATPDHWHAIPVLMAAESGKDIYCEKPLSLTLYEAREMVNAVRKYRRVFQTGSMQRSDNKFRLACELVRNGYIGEIKKVNVSIRTGFIAHPVECDLSAESVPSELNWEFWLGPAPWRPYHSILAPPISFTGWPKWRDYRDYSGGGMTDWGAHHFDIAQWGLGMDHSGPVKIIPPDGKDIKQLTFLYANGVEMTTDVEDNLILFTGTEGKVAVNRSYIKTWPEKLVRHPISARDLHLYESNNHKQNWLDCIKTRKHPICDVEIGCRSVSVCHLGNLAVQLGRPLLWNPEAELFINDPEANRLRDRSKRSPWSLS